MNNLELKAIREGWRMSQSRFADLLGASARTYQEWEQGRAGVPGPVAKHVETIGKLRQIYGHWDQIARAQYHASRDALDALSDDHEKLWGELFPELDRMEDDAELVRR